MFIHLTTICLNEKFLSFPYILHILRNFEIIMDFYIFSDSFPSFIYIWWFICCLKIFCIILCCFFTLWFFISRFFINSFLFVICFFRCILLCLLCYIFFFLLLL